MFMRASMILMAMRSGHVSSVRPRRIMVGGLRLTPQGYISPVIPLAPSQVRQLPGDMMALFASMILMEISFG